MKNGEEDILKAVLYSGMSAMGPDVKSYYPHIELLDRPLLSLLAIKSITLLTGEEGEVPDKISVILFSKYQMMGIVYHFEVIDKTSRGGVVDSDLMILFNEKFSSIAYKYSDLFETLLKEVASAINKCEQANDKEGIEKLMRKLYEKLHQNLASLKKAEDEALKKIPKKEDFRFKVVVIGDGGVGKTTTLLRYVDNCFHETYLPTIGVNVSNKIIPVGIKNIKLNFFDIAGQEKFELMRRVFYEGLDAAVVMFDVTNIESFEHLEKWLEDVKAAFKAGDKKVRGIIVGNKLDLKSQRLVNKMDAEKIATKHGLEYMEISAKTGENVNQAFNKVAQAILEK